MDRKAKTDPRLLAAIHQKRLIELCYDGTVRVAEPHDYGIRKGEQKLLSYQLEPITDWRLFEVGKMSDVRVLARTFRGGRPTSSGEHHKWDVLFARVGSGE